MLVGLCTVCLRGYVLYVGGWVVGVHDPGPHLARHHGPGEQLVELHQLIGRAVELESYAVQRVPGFHLDHKTREKGVSWGCRLHGRIEGAGERHACR